MSSDYNGLLNGVLALVRGDVATAREYFRFPSSGVKDIPGIMARTYEALDELKEKHLEEQLMEIFRQTMTLKPGGNIKNKDDFERGVIAVEQILQNRLEHVKGRKAVKDYVIS